jgi:2'-hydroxyisoflavone reductase
MNLLILGGTVFLGKHTVEAALARGHRVTLFNRGRTNPDLFRDDPRVEIITGDRDGELGKLAGRTWDAAIDPSGYVPRVVRASAEFLADKVGHYTFISSISVYADTSQPGQDESAAVGTLDDPTVEQITGESYGPLKALCEQAAQEAMPGRVAIVRPGLIVGPDDPSDRFTYWPMRIADGGEVLAPGRPDYPTEFTDVRDLGEWLVHVAEERITGLFNASGPGPEKTTLGQIFDVSRRISGEDVTVTWVSESFLNEQEVAPWSQMPLWVGDGPAYAGFSFFDTSAAIAHGLTFRSMEETIQSTLEWAKNRPADHPWRAGISREREAELLSRWHQ